MLNYFNPERTVLLVIDIQNDFCHPDGFLARNGKDLGYIQKMLPKLRWFVSAARMLGIRIIFIKSHFDEKHLSASMRIRKKSQGRTEDVCPEESWGSELIMTPKPDDLVIVKHAFSAFIGTPLKDTLREKNIESIAITGVLTNVCCESTLRDGFMLGFNTVLIEDCCASENIDAHNATIYNVNGYFGCVSTSDQLVDSWIGYRGE